MSSGTRAAATVDDLYKIDGKAELIAGRIVRYMPTGRRPGRVAFRIARALDDWVEANGVGEAYADNVGFTVPELSSGRRSFAPDAAFFSGPFPDNEMRFLEGPPTFAVEVRSEGDYAEPAEAAMEHKRADYFEAGTLVIWDVAPNAGVIHCYRAAAPDQPTDFLRGEVADAEPAVPGWRIAVDEIFG